MPYTDVFEWPPILVSKDIVDFVQRLQSFDNVPEHRVFAVKVVYVVREGDEKLASTAASVTIERWRNCHGHCTLGCMLQLWNNLRCEVAWCGGVSTRRYVGPHGLSTCSRGCGIACLSEKVL